MAAVFTASLAAFAPSTATPVTRQSAAEIRALLDAGNYTLAAELGQSLASADGLALASEALSAPVLLATSEDPKDQAKTAHELAKEALALDPSHIDAHMQIALTLGFITRASNPITVWRKGLAGDLKDAIDAFEALAPNDARVHALRGAWHYGIVRKAGEGRAENWYSATMTDGNAAYDRALELSPHDIIIEANYALSLVEADYDANQSRARAMIEDCTDETAKTAVERAVQDRMNAIHARWDEPDFVRAEAARWLDGE